MNPLNRYFDKVIWIGSKEHRPDRAAEMEAELAKWGIEALYFSAHWKPENSGNWGCSASHRSVLGLICAMGWARTLILEDDNAFVDSQWPEMFSEMVLEVPDDWQFLFLGGGYAEDPKRRVSGSVIQTNAMMTTSSYGITLEMAPALRPVHRGQLRHRLAVPRLPARVSQLLSGSEALRATRQLERPRGQLFPEPQLDARQRPRRAARPRAGRAARGRTPGRQRRPSQRARGAAGQ